MNAQQFTLASLEKTRQRSNSAWTEFLNTTTMSMGLYHVTTGTDDSKSHTPHDRDEVYVGISGVGRLTVDQQEFEIEPGAIVYVKAGVKHHFHDVIEDLTVLVYFAGPPVS